MYTLHSNFSVRRGGFRVCVNKQVQLVFMHCYVVYPGDPENSPGQEEACCGTHPLPPENVDDPGSSHKPWHHCLAPPHSISPRPEIGHWESWQARTSINSTRRPNLRGGSLGSRWRERGTNSEKRWRIGGSSSNGRFCAASRRERCSELRRGIQRTLWGQWIANTSNPCWCSLTCEKEREGTC